MFHESMDDREICNTIYISIAFDIDHMQKTSRLNIRELVLIFSTKMVLGVASILLSKHSCRAISNSANSAKTQPVRRLCFCHES